MMKMKNWMLMSYCFWMVQGQDNIFAEETAENDYHKDLKTVDYLQKYVAKYNQIVAPYGEI